jgi:hypothetical protein
MGLKKNQAAAAAAIRRNRIGRTGDCERARRDFFLGTTNDGSAGAGRLLALAPGYLT